MHQISVILCIIFFLTVGAAVNGLVAQSFVSKSGIEVSAGLKLDKKEIMIGEAMYFSFEVFNHSGIDFYTPVGGDYRNNLGRPDSYNVTVVRSDGFEAFQPKVTFGMGGLIGMQKVPATGKFATRLFLPHWAKFEKPGKYKVTVEKWIPIRNDNSSSFFRKEDETSDVFKATASAEIEVLPTDHRKMGELIDTWGKKLMDMNDTQTEEAASMLEHSKDKRSIVYFAEAVERYSRPGSPHEEKGRIRQAAFALAHFDNDFAFFALKRTMSHADQDVRGHIAYALGISPHANAAGTLLLMQGDKNYSVRLQVAHRFAKIRTDEARNLMIRFLKDENEYVRQVAEEYLKETK